MTTERVIASERLETDPCERGTAGCCIDHMAEDAAESACEAW